MSARASVPAASDVQGGSDGPVRMCVGCRARERVDRLIRVVAVDGNVIPDPRRRRPGRGAWLHPDPECLDAAERRRVFGRALRVAGQLDLSQVRAYLSAGAAGPGSVRTPAGRSVKPTGTKAGRPNMSTP